jgi:hypothetical protein
MNQPAILLVVVGYRVGKCATSDKETAKRSGGYASAMQSNGDSVSGKWIKEGSCIAYQQHSIVRSHWSPEYQRRSADGIAGSFPSAGAFFEIAI